MADFPHITKIEHEGAVVLAPIGDFDIASVDLLRETFVDTVGPSASKLVVDLSGTTFLDSMALGTIIGVTKRAKGWGGWVRLVSPQPSIRRVLHATGLDKVYGLYDTVEQAVCHVEVDDPVETVV